MTSNLVLNRMTQPDLTSGWKQSFRRAVLRWFDRNARDLPWRRTRNLYQVWVSEIMLQQTQVATVIPYFERFVEQFPTVEQLAAADEQQVLRAWEGLGYYRRARQLHHAARLVVEQHHGVFPTEIEQLRSLPGIGRYTAGAILSISLDQRHPILEANTVRLFSRLTAFRGDPSGREGQQRLWEFAEAILPRRRVGDFNQGLMELGATVCAVRQPDCETCPVLRLCPTYAQGLQQQIPAPKRKRAYTDVYEAAVVVKCRGKLLLRCCQPGERWAGLWDFPRFQLDTKNGQPKSADIAAKVAELTGVAIRPTRHLTTLRHGVTRFRITLECHEATSSRQVTPRDHLRWVKLPEMAELPLSVTGREIWQLLCDQSP
jgi:A/G-specific adenine glycosylase